MIGKFALILIVAVLCICPVVNSKAVEETKAVDEIKAAEETKAEEIINCIDTRSDCDVYATQTYCSKRPDYMGVHCCRTCRERYWGAVAVTVWTQWTGYGACSRSCGGGIRSRTRQCTGYCLRNEEVESISCNNQICTACIDTRSDCFTFATASNCQNGYDYRGGLANRYDYRGIYGLHGLHGLHGCCRTCADRYGGGRLGPFGQLPLIPNVCNDDVAGCAQDADKCHSYSTDWTSYMATHCKRTCGYCH